MHMLPGWTRCLPGGCYANSALKSRAALLLAETHAETRGLLLRCTWSGNQHETAPVTSWLEYDTVGNPIGFEQRPLFKRPALGGPLFYLRVRLIRSCFLIKREGLAVRKVVGKQKDHVSCVFLSMVESEDTPHCRISPFLWQPGFWGNYLPTYSSMQILTPVEYLICSVASS